MSQVSMCEAPPLSQIMIADLATLRPGEDAIAEDASPKLTPLATRKVRRSSREAGRKSRTITSGAPETMVTQKTDGHNFGLVTICDPFRRMSFPQYPFHSQC